MRKNLALLGMVALAAGVGHEPTFTPMGFSSSRIYGRAYGPGRNQRKRRKYARQNPHSSKWKRRM